ncbi:MAG TPA: hypothetical protein VKB93_18435 [Thermoanaerobaculia bacterium]|nr:hypothetical protein [Thermoanaerobaculia bacterium]
MMTHVLFFAGFLTLPLFGLWTWRLSSVQQLNLAGRIAVAGCAGALGTALLMSVFPFWTAAAQLPLSLALLWSGGLQPAGFFPRRAEARRSTSLYILAFIALTVYGILTARESAGDLHFFWGPKAIHFAKAGGIDVAFLANKTHPNPDYPPLVPLVFAWCTYLAGGFSWWAALLSSALCLAGCVAIVHSFTGDDAGTLLLASTLAWCFAIGYAAGGADPPLLLFETLTLCALTFRKDTDLLAAIGLAGAAFTKVEGATFVIAVVLAMFGKRILKIAAPALVILSAWLAFLIANGLIFGYGGAKTPIHLDMVTRTVTLVFEAGLYRMNGLPWIVPILLLAYRRRAFPLLVCALTLGATIFFYIHSRNPDWWISASAMRVLMTPLTALIVAVLQSRADGVVPQGEEAERSGREGRDPRGALGQV